MLAAMRKAALGQIDAGRLVRLFAVFLHNNQGNGAYQYNPVGIAFTPRSSSGDKFAYTALDSPTTAGNAVTACKVNESGQLTDCAQTGGGTATFVQFPPGIAVNGNFLYVTNGAGATVCDVDGLDVTNCRLAATFNTAHGLALT